MQTRELTHGCGCSRRKIQRNGSTGSFPLTSSTFDYRNGATTAAVATADAVQVHNNGAADATTVSINLGTTKQHLATFRLSNSSVEGVHLKKLITLYNNQGGTLRCNKPYTCWDRDGVISFPCDGDLQQVCNIQTFECILLQKK